MSTLKNTIESLAAQFASSIVNALKGAAIDELAGYTGHTSAHAAPPAAAAPPRRGPGRPKKAAAAPAAPAAAAPAAPAPKKRGRPAGSGKKAAAAPKSAPKTAPKTAPKSGGGRLARRSMADIGSVVQDIVSLLGRHPEGLRSEQIRSELGLQAKELPRPLADGLAAGTITKVGQKRATTYFAGSGKGKKKK